MYTRHPTPYLVRTPPPPPWAWAWYPSWRLMLHDQIFELSNILNTVYTIRSPEAPGTLREGLGGLGASGHEY